MGYLIGTVLTIFLLTSVFLIFLVLIQSGKGGGGLGAFGGGASQTAFGSSSADVLTKATRYSAIIFIILALTLSFLFAKKQDTILPETSIVPDPSSLPAVTIPAEASKSQPVTDPQKTPATQSPSVPEQKK